MDPEENRLNCSSVEDFKSRINDILHDAYKNHLGADYVAGKIDDAARENPDFAKQFGLNNFSEINRGVQKALEFGPGGRPLVMPKASDFDLFLLGVRIEKANPTKDLTKEELQKINEDAKKLLILYGALTGGTIAAASAPYWAPALIAACSGGYVELMVFAASAKGQEAVKWLPECASSLFVDNGPPPSNGKEVFCTGLKHIYETSFKNIR